MKRCVTDYLVHEHQELSHLLNELQEELRVLPMARNVAEKSERLNRLCRRISKTLHLHLQEEETILYPALEGHIKGISATLDRMRHDHDAGEAVEKTFLQCLAFLAKHGSRREEVMQSGRKYIQWLRGHLLNENGRLFPIVERSLDPETQRAVRRAMEELGQETTARLAEGMRQAAQA